VEPRALLGRHGSGIANCSSKPREGNQIRDRSVAGRGGPGGSCARSFTPPRPASSPGWAAGGPDFSTEKPGGCRCTPRSRRFWPERTASWQIWCHKAKKSRRTAQVWSAPFDVCWASSSPSSSCSGEGLEADRKAGCGAGLASQRPGCQGQPQRAPRPASKAGDRLEEGPVGQARPSAPPEPRPGRIRAVVDRWQMPRTEKRRKPATPIAAAIVGATAIVTPMATPQPRPTATAGRAAPPHDQRRWRRLRPQGHRRLLQPPAHQGEAGDEPRHQAAAGHRGRSTIAGLCPQAATNGTVISTHGRSPARDRSGIA